MGKEDMEYIEDLMVEIYEKGKHLTFETINKSLGGKLRRDHIGIEALNNQKNLKPEEMFVFLSEEKFIAAIREFFSNRYNIKHIAKVTYELDEGDKFIECMDMNEDIGIVIKENGEAVKSSLMEVKMKVMPWGERDGRTGLPFKIMRIRPIESDWDNPKDVKIAKEIELGGWEQITLMNFLSEEVTVNQ